MPTVTITEESMPATDKLRAELESELEAAGVEFHAAFKARQLAAEKAKEVAQRAHKAGMTPGEIAGWLGVDPTRTIRRWLRLSDNWASP